jgi:hypothetical protein
MDEAFYSQQDIDSFSLKGVRQPGSLVGRQSEPIDLTDYSNRMATGRKPSKKPPTEVELEYFNRVKKAMAAGKKPGYLVYNGQKWFYNRGGTKGPDGVKDLSLRSLSGKLNLEKKYADTRNIQTPTLEDYETAFPGKGKQMFEAEQLKRKQQVNVQKDAIKRTGVNFDLDHMRPNMNEGRTHSRNFRLMNAGRNRLEQNRRPISPEQLTALKQDATNNIDYIKTEGPELTPRQRQTIIDAPDSKVPNVSRVNIKGGAARFSAVIPWFDYLGPLDQATGGHIESTIDKGVNVVRQSLGFKPNPVGHTPVKDPITSFGNGVARRIWDLGNMLTNQTNHYPADIQ